MMGYLSELYLMALRAEDQATLRNLALKRACLCGASGGHKVDEAELKAALAVIEDALRGADSDAKYELCACALEMPCDVVYIKDVETWKRAKLGNVHAVCELAEKLEAAAGAELAEVRKVREAIILSVIIDDVLPAAAAVAIKVRAILLSKDEERKDEHGGHSPVFTAVRYLASPNSQRLASLWYAREFVKLISSYEKA